MTVGQRIATWRKLKGLTQQDLAKAAKITPAAVYQWEAKGETRTLPSLRHLERCVKALGLTMEQFYGAIPDEARAS